MSSLPTVGASARRTATSGWVPLLVVVAGFVVLSHHDAHVALGDVVVFLGYLAGWIVLPGAVLWRLIDPRRERRLLAEDLAIGALVGYVIEFPVYIACLAIGHPHAYVLWPVVPLVVLATPLGRRVRHLGEGRLPTWWTWSAAAVSLYVVVWASHYVWGPTPDKVDRMSRPYVDEPYHLSLAAGLKHFFPPRVIYVDHTPLNYHWLSHLHIAASSWVTGVEPIVLLRTLALPALLLIVLLAAALIVARLSDARWAGLVLLAAVAVTPANFSVWGDGGGEPLVGLHFILSPSAGFVNAALLLGIFLCVELLSHRERAWAATALTFVSFVAMAGAKSTSLPTLMGGLVLATLVSSLARRAIDRRAALLAALSLVAFEVAKLIFFGAGSHGLAIDPLALVTSQAKRVPGLLDASGHMSTGVRIVVATYMLSYLALGTGALALLARRGWRRADHVFVAGVCAAGLVAGLTFHQSSYSEYYFVYVVALPLMVGAALGLRHVAAGLPARETVVVGAITLALTALAALTYGWITIETDGTAAPGSPMHLALRLYALPMAVAIAIAVILVTVIEGGRRLITGRRMPGMVLVITVIVAAGMGTGSFLRSVPTLLAHPVGAVAPVVGTPTIGDGGINAARWLRAHSATSDLVATNAHCASAHQAACVARNFWMAGYSERQFLVEGWSYVSRWSIGEHPPADEDVTNGPFWDPTRLRINDAIFRRPSAQTLETMHQHYDVRWLFVDTRYPVNLPDLEKFAGVAYAKGRYVVLKLN